MMQTPQQQQFYEQGSAMKGIKGASGVVREVVALNPNRDDDDDNGYGGHD